MLDGFVLRPGFQSKLGLNLKSRDSSPFPSLASSAHGIVAQQHVCRGTKPYTNLERYALEFPSKRNQAREHVMFLPLPQYTRDLGTYRGGRPSAVFTPPAARAEVMVTGLLLRRVGDLPHPIPAPRRVALSPPILRAPPCRVTSDYL
jgi:hypothetical protein